MACPDLNRERQLARAQDAEQVWDLLVIGGGATGAGVAVDAAARGYSVLLCEAADFGSGTSSRSTKLVHGGVRYLQQGNLSLVMEALHERGRLLRNAPHLVRELGFVVPHYAWWEAPWYGIGLKVYDMLAGKYGFGSSKLLSKESVLQAIPTLETDGLRGGVRYFDGQFDDARLLICLVQTAATHGATVLNHARVSALNHDSDGLIRGATIQDLEQGQEFAVRARAVINATGAFVDEVRRLDDDQTSPIVTPSQGVHLVFDRRFLPGDTAIMVPRTRDKRVMFAIPWHGHTLVGTTDTPIERATLEPRAQADEIDFLLETSAEYLEQDPTRDDVLSLWTGIRPLVGSSEEGSTASVSRDHTVLTSKSGLVTITGGKWTTYRRMAKDVVQVAATLGGLEERPCPTKELRLHGWREPNEAHEPLRGEDPFSEYGADAAQLHDLSRQFLNPARGERIDLSTPLHPDLPICAAHLLWGVRHEMARTVEDLLARRTRALFLNAAAAASMAPIAAAILSTELERDASWEQHQVDSFTALAARYLPPRA